MKIGFLGLLAILFIGLKLANLITWSWWLVLLPLYGGPLLLILLPLIAVGLAAIATWVASRTK